MSDVLSQQPLIAPEVTQEEPASPAGFSVVEPKAAGCWEITLDDVQLTARWVAACDAPPVRLGAHGWRAGVLRLPGTESDPPRAHAQVQATLSSELAQRGEGALLFLPIAKSGAGYYVAAWAAPEERDAPDSEQADVEPSAPPAARGYQVGRYGTAPVSVLTPVGRVYLQPDFAPHRALAHNATGELEPDMPVDLVDEPAVARGPTM